MDGPYLSERGQDPNNGAGYPQGKGGSPAPARARVLAPDQ